jgi:hypothetical protein
MIVKAEILDEGLLPRHCNRNSIFDAEGLDYICSSCRPSSATCAASNGNSGLRDERPEPTEAFGIGNIILGEIPGLALA